MHAAHRFGRAQADDDEEEMLHVTGVLGHAYGADGSAAEGEEYDEGDEEEHAEAEEEQRIDTYPLPPLPPVMEPPTVHGIETSAIYGIIVELRRQRDDPVGLEHAKNLLRSDPNVLRAVAQVLHESHLLRATRVNDQGDTEEYVLPLPEAPRPTLPTGFHSWIADRETHFA